VLLVWGPAGRPGVAAVVISRLDGGQDVTPEVGRDGEAASTPPPEEPARPLGFLIQHAFDRYFESGGLFGTVQDGLATLGGLDAIGVDEVACLIDFVPDTDAVLDGLHYLGGQKDAWETRATA
jgi:hypothetical protein